jgi:hypothetical protein
MWFAVQSSSSSCSSLQFQFLTDALQAAGFAQGEPWFYLRLGHEQAQ